VIKGITPVINPTAEQFNELKRLGVEKLRLINVEHDEQRRSKLLGYCRDYGFIPHIIIGQHSMGYTWPPDWDSYKTHIELMIDEVADFDQTVWEVGNEIMHNGGWINPDSNSWDAETYNRYKTLYWEIAEVFEGKDSTQLGGWASAAHPWLSSFLQMGTKIKMDFVGIHWYGYGQSISEVVSCISKAKTYNDIPVWLTESGYNSFWNLYPELQGSKQARYWYSMLIECAAEWGIDEIYPLKIEGDDYGIWKNGIELTEQGFAVICGNIGNLDANP